MLPKFLKPFHISKSNLIRIGPKTDGGYIVDKRIFNKTDTLITCGLNDDWEFEKSFLKKNKNSKRIFFLLIEFHNVHTNLIKIRNFITKSDLKIIHTHANNYGGIDKNGIPNVIEL